MTAAHTAPIALSRSRRRDEHLISRDPIVGKDILELLSSAMYLDPRSVYREYVQNAADAIDEAFATGVLDAPDLGTVSIDLDTLNRGVRIRDDGIGIPAAEAERVLTSFGASAKRTKTLRGFRGVGRLAAFGYAQTVSFKTKAKNERVSTEVVWDCRRLKSALIDPTYTGDLRQIVRDVVSVINEDGLDLASHYFEVKLDKVLRIKNDLLLNVDEIRRYLGEVVPCPFHDDFPFAPLILEHLAGHVAPPRFRILLNGSPEPITRPHRAQFALTAAKTDDVTDVELLTVPDEDGGTQAVGWILHHGYVGAIHAAEDVKGLRARVGDIQIGTGDLFLDAFHEARFNSWTIGELHIVSPRVVPNGRRDGFEQNGAYSALMSQVTLVARRQATRCRQSSTRRNRLKAFELREEKVRELFGVLNHRGTSKPLALKTRREIGAAFNEMRRLSKSNVLAEEDQRRLARRIGALTSRFDGLRELADVADPFADASPAQRTVYSQMIDLIYDCSNNKSAARALVDKIMARLTARAIRTRRRTSRGR